MESEQVWKEARGKYINTYISYLLIFGISGEDDDYGSTEWYGIQWVYGCRKAAAGANSNTQSN